MNRSLLLGLFSLALLSSCTDNTPASSGGAPGAEAPAGGHSHDEVSLGKIQLGEHEVSLAQGHGKVMAGKEGHLVVSLPYSDSGASIVRAWLGGPDRTKHLVGKADYSADHNEYNLHAVAPEPLPADIQWWIEVELPDGEKLLGSIDPILK